MSGVSISLSNNNDSWPGAGVSNSGNESVNGNDGDDTLDGGVGNDWLFGGLANDSLIGGVGNDSFRTGNGDDTVIGGEGTDVLDYTLSSLPFTIDLATGIKTSPTDHDFAIGVENVIGGNGGDAIAGDSLDNVIDGYIGNDTINSGAGNDTLIGGSGDDSLTSGTGRDSLLGGAGNDTLIAGSDNDALLNNLSGGDGNDWLDFSGGAEAFTRAGAESGNDTLIGGNGNDTLDLQSGWSFLSTSGAYSLYQDGADTIWAEGWETVVCFAKGVRIVTPHGEDAVENLRAGDMVLAMRGGQAGFEPLRWVGFMDVAVPRNAAMAANAAPILIKAGALA
jgi:Ca2+-binding RTX toxin-like protein